MATDLTTVRELIAAENGLAVVATLRADGSAQASVVNAGLVAHPLGGEDVVGFVAMGIGLEFLQGLTDYRTFEVADMMADAAGVSLGWLAAPPRLPEMLRYVEARWPIS